MNPTSIYDDALSQLHLNYQTLQETMMNLGREQSKIFESVTRIQNDLESYKDSQNDRLDEILTNIDSDIRKVSQDAQKFAVQSDHKLSEFIRESVTQKQMDSLRTDLRDVKKELDETKQNDNDNTAAIAELNAQIEISQKDLTSFKAETAEKLQKAVAEGGKISSGIENSCMTKLEHYIGTEIVDEIVGTINIKLCHMKSDIQNELELQKIQIEETCTKVGNLKTKISDLENPKKSFDLSDLMASSMDVTRTPFQGKFFRTPTRPSSPILETDMECTEYVEEVSSTPRVASDHQQTAVAGYDPVEVEAEVSLSLGKFGANFVLFLKQLEDSSVLSGGGGRDSVRGHSAGRGREEGETRDEQRPRVSDFLLSARQWRKSTFCRRFWSEERLICINERGYK